ncbi:MAG: PH domain-containing protein [Bacteroidetes bacterium]|nr:PH domain-containing protein [Bacteroidota bacterium]
MRTKLKNSESVVLLVRPHWLTLALPSLYIIVGVILGVLIGPYGYFIPLVLLCYLWYKIVQRNNNLWAVTNLRVIDEDGVFSHNSKESPLDKINNVTYSQSIWGRIFGYGDVQIQTAAEIGSTSYYTIEKPKELKDTITQMQEEYKKSQIIAQARELANAISSGTNPQSKKDVSDEIEKLFELKQKGILTEEEFTAGKKKILGE